MKFQVKKKLSSGCDVILNWPNYGIAEVCTERQDSFDIILLGIIIKRNHYRLEKCFKLSDELIFLVDGSFCERSRNGRNFLNGEENFTIDFCTLSKENCFRFHG